MKRKLALILAALMFSGCVSCGDTNSTPETTTAVTEETTRSGTQISFITDSIGEDFDAIAQSADFLTFPEFLRYSLGVHPISCLKNFEKLLISG